jgi:hypothetical protein
MTLLKKLLLTVERIFISGRVKWAEIVWAEIVAPEDCQLFVGKRRTMGSKPNSF